MWTYTPQDILGLSPFYGLPRTQEKISTTIAYYPPELANFAATTIVNFYWNSYYVAVVFNYTLYCVLGGVIAIASLRHLAGNWMNNRLPRWLLPVQTFVQKHFFYAASWGSSSSRPVSFVGATGFLGRWTTFQIPTRVHGILVGLYVLANLVICFTYRICSPNLYYPELGYPRQQIFRAFADRTAILSFGSTPLVIALAGRNSLISALTGASFSTLQIYHRWVARVTFFTALGHSLAWAVGEVVNYLHSGLSTDFSQAYWNWGVAAMAGGFLLVIASTRRLREISYEFFLVGHIAGAVVWVVGCYYHVFLLDEFEYLTYIYATIAIWGFDRVVRWLRLAWLNLPFGGKSVKTHQVGALAAEGQLLKGGDFVRVRVSLATAWPSAFGGPGTYVFISAPGLGIFQSHPFTIAWPTDMPGSPAHEQDELDEKKDSQSFVNEFDDSDLITPNSFELLLRPYSGFTRKLVDSLTDKSLDSLDQAHPVKRIKLLVEGPYGHTVDLKDFGTIILVVGGSGVACAIAHLAHLAKLAKEGTLGVQRVILVWSVKDANSSGSVLSPFLHRLLPLFHSAPPSFLSVFIHYTGSSVSSSDKDHEARPSSASISSALANIEAEYASLAPSITTTAVQGRIVVEKYLDKVLDYAGERVALAACGPSGLCDASREAVRSRLGAAGVGARDLEYHEEAFNW